MICRLSSETYYWMLSLNRQSSISDMSAAWSRVASNLCLARWTSTCRLCISSVNAAGVRSRHTCVNVSSFMASNMPGACRWQRTVAALCFGRRVRKRWWPMGAESVKSLSPCHLYLSFPTPTTSSNNQPNLHHTWETIETKARAGRRPNPFFPRPALLARFTTCFGGAFLPVWRWLD